MTVEDPFGTPAPIPSTFPSPASFRGRLVLIKPTRIELDALKGKDGKKADKVTATVTVVDGLGDVELMPQQIPSGQFVEGPVYQGVWFDQDRLVKAICPGRKLNERMTLGRIDTFKPGPAKEGNPWGLNDPTEADKETARAFLKSQKEATVDAALGKTEPVNPFG